MNKQELIEELMRRSKACSELFAESPSGDAALRLSAKSSTYQHAAELASQFDDAPQWQDEPGGDGWYWVKHDPEPRYVITLDGVSKCRNRKGTEYVPLAGRQVCPVSPPPVES